jgi:beta-N-acetylhexosaminidase
MKKTMFLSFLCQFFVISQILAQPADFVKKAVANELSRIEKSIVVLHNQNQLPVKNLGQTSVCVITYGDSAQNSVFSGYCGYYTKISAYQLSFSAKTTEIQNIAAKAIGSKLLIVHIQASDSIYPEKLKPVLDLAAQSPNSILSVSGNPENIAKLLLAGKFKAQIYSPANDKITLSYIPQIIFGGLQATGKLAQNIPGFKAGEGIVTQQATRFKFTWPEELGISTSSLAQKIDSVAEFGIGEQAYPGCVVLAAKDGKVFFYKSYGSHTYYKNEPTRCDDLFDFASVTKISTSVAALLKLYDEGKIKTTDKISKYYDFWRGSNKADIRFVDALTHTARLTPFIPFHKELVEKEGYFNKNWLTPYPTKENTVRLTKTLFMNPKFQGQVYKAIKDSPLNAKREYKYSDLSFMIYPKVVEAVTKTPFEQFLKETIYRPLGAYSLTFNPLNENPASKIAPTENDNYFRNCNLQGYVHDEGAALLGGVSGHAGLFGTALDLAKLMQMYLWRGTYGDVRFYSDSTFQRFNSVPFAADGIRRGIGFDKPLLDNATQTYNESYPAPCVSPESFGHSGYTGTFTWADPKNGFLLVFFTNRVQPVRTDKLGDLRLRKGMLKAFYDELGKQ